MNKRIKSVFDVCSGIGGLITIGAAVVAIAPIVWAFTIEKSMPAWLAALVAVFSFLAGCLIGRRWPSMRKAKENKGLRIGFDYLPEPPTEHGWHFFEKEDPPPRFLRSQHKGFGTCLKISLQGGKYALDYALSETQSKQRFLEYAVRPGRRAGVYAEVNLVKPDRTDSHQPHLRFDIARDTQTAGTERTREVGIGVTPYDKIDGWSFIRVDLIDAVQKAFGQYGWKLDCIKTIRLRGEIVLAYIDFRQ